MLRTRRLQERAVSEKEGESNERGRRRDRQEMLVALAAATVGGLPEMLMA
jgi:hypothetical protein